jgi:hypothetical protein
MTGQPTTSQFSQSLQKSCAHRIKAAKLAVSAVIGSQAGQQNVDICPACRKRPISDVLEVMYLAHA